VSGGGRSDARGSCRGRDERTNPGRSRRSPIATPREGCGGDVGLFLFYNYSMASQAGGGKGGGRAGGEQQNKKEGSKGNKRAAVAGGGGPRPWRGHGHLCRGLYG